MFLHLTLLTEKGKLRPICCATFCAPKFKVASEFCGARTRGPLSRRGEVLQGGSLEVKSPFGGIGRSAQKLRGENSQDSSLQKLGNAERRDSSEQAVGIRRSARAGSVSRCGGSSRESPPPIKFRCQDNRPLGAADLGGEFLKLSPQTR